MPNRISWLRTHAVIGAEEESEGAAQAATEPDPASTEPDPKPDSKPDSNAFEKIAEDARKEAAKYRKRAQAAEKKLEDAAQADLSETEKSKARADLSDKRAETAEAELQKIKVESVVSRAASALKFNDSDDALRMIDLSSLEYDEDTGLPVKSSVNKALKKLIEQKPYLTSDEINIMAAEGFAIGAHSKNHPEFNLLSAEEVEKRKPQTQV